MKKKILLGVLAACLICVSAYVYADTTRLGFNHTTVSFNPTAIVSKTAAYTLTASDSLCNVATSTATITITLPTVASTRPGRQAYKVVKTDANPYDVILAAASGDTVGGETVRHITAQNGYIIVSTGTGSDWQVDYETDYMGDDHSAGTVTLPPTTITGAVSAATGQTTLGASVGPVHTRSVTFSNESGFLMTNQNGTRMRVYLNNSSITARPR